MRAKLVRFIAITMFLTSLPAAADCAARAAKIAVQHAADIELFSEPEEKGKWVVRMHFGTALDVLEKKDECVKVNGIEGRWIKVRVKPSVFGTPAMYGGHLDSNDQGWIFDGHVAYLDMFQPVRHWKGPFAKDVCWASEGECDFFEISADGKFRSKKDSRIGREVGNEAQIYSYKNIILLGSPSQAIGTIDDRFLFVDRKGKICPYARLELGECDDR